MMMWSERLQAVPYSQWTLGASTALDHWIARQVLRLSEETWQCLLEGVDDPTLLSRGREIVQVRESLFPETALGLKSTDSSRMEDLYDLDAGDDDRSPSKDEPSIEELLASLGGLSSPASDKSGLKWLEEEDEDAGDLDSKVNKLVNELQDWRRKNVETPYQDWSKDDKDSFGVWMKEYISAVSSDAARAQVDYDSTREALLSQPPSNKDESEAFWSQLQDEGDAATLLDAMIQSGPPPGASFLHSAFWELPYEKQLERLLNLGALRPLLDEYAKESERVTFLKRYGDTLLTGVELEHLVPDPEGPVRASDIGPDASGLGISADDRFRLVLLPYRASPNMSAPEKTRALFAAWNQHKAGRARYEEKMFRTGRLGLRYDSQEKEK